MQKQTNEAKNKEFEELVVEVKSVTKVTKGGRNRRFSARRKIIGCEHKILVFVVCTSGYPHGFDRFADISEFSLV